MIIDFEKTKLFKKISEQILAAHFLIAFLSSGVFEFLTIITIWNSLHLILGRA